MKRLALGVAAALMLGAGQAAAEGLPADRGEVWSPEGPDVGIWRWTGFYGGVGIGGGTLEVDALGQDGDGEGILGTVVLGYDRQLGSRWVAGVFTDFDFSDTSADVGGFGDVDQVYSWAVGGRLGALITPKTLLYATGGYTLTELEGGLEGTADGYFVGGGLEHMLRPNWSLKLEYRYSDFEADVEDAGGFDAGDAELASHTGRLVLSYKFGGPRY